jgi:hypothetical protein
LSPKLSNDHIPGSNTKSPDAASPQATKFVELVIVAPPLCAAAVVPATPLVTPVNSPVVAIPVYDISSLPIIIKFVPAVGNCDESTNIIPVVAVSVIPFCKVVFGSPATSPPQDPNDQPKPLA